MPPRADQPWPLSVHRAFVVQLHADANVEEGCVIGRVEHVVSGQMATFQSVEDLLRFMAGTIRGMPEAFEPRPPG